jgi:hypothetical protein
VVTLDEVTICSPFHPHLPHLGRCGAHFVGINVRRIPWSYYGPPATEVRLKHWQTIAKKCTGASDWSRMLA